ncbi:MAG: hypothetical protein WBD27_05025 [Pyrinomonadaceae bacterium]
MFCYLVWELPPQTAIYIILIITYALMGYGEAFSYMNKKDAQIRMQYAKS